MAEPNSVLGIDISKLKVDVCLITTIGGKEKYRTFKNDEGGFAELAKFLIRHDVENVHACFLNRLAALETN